MAIAELYETLTGLAGEDLRGAATETALRELIIESMELIAGAEFIELKSNVPGKEYGMAKLDERRSRPINKALFDPNAPKDVLLDAVFQNGAGVDPAALDRCLYTAAMA